MENATPPGSGFSSGQPNRKRTFEQMSQESGEASNPVQAIRQSASSSLNQRFPPPPSPLRYPGDGFDFRRPVMSAGMSTPNGVIDLTDDTEPVPTRSASVPRGRRFQREGTGQATQTSLRTTEEPEVIDLDDEQEAEARRRASSQEQVQRQGRRDGSPDVEFLYSNASQRPPRAPAPVEPRLFGNVYPGSGSSDPFHLADFMRYMSRIAGVNTSRANTSRALDPVTVLARHRYSQRQRYRSRPTHPTTASRFLLPEMDYTTLGFSPPPPTAPSRARATYTKPPAPRDGFTRAPGEDDIVVCPNCDHELGSGDDDTRRQIWVVKACGHAYCGECSKLRSKKSKAARGNSTTQPFSKCVIEECGVKTSAGKAMIQIYI